MTDTEINLAIAEACGQPLDNAYHEITNPPDYCADLNAMHEAEKIMNPRQCGHYMGHLQHVMFRDPDPQYPSIHAGIFAWHATAGQRAEAFLRTIGKWKD